MQKQLGITKGGLFSGIKNTLELCLQETSIISHRLNCAAVMTIAKRWEKETSAALENFMWILWLVQVSSPVITLFPNLPSENYPSPFNNSVELLIILECPAVTGEGVHVLKTCSAQRMCLPWRSTSLVIIGLQMTR